MTLIVASLVNDVAVIVSDTALTKTITFQPYPSNYLARYVGDEEANHRQGHFIGTLKTIILSPKLCICYANTAEYALAAINHIKENLDLLILDNVLEFLLVEHLRYSEALRPDFIVAALKDGRPILNKIQNGKIEQNLQTCWIGSQSAFEHYQRFFHHQKLFYESLMVDQPQQDVGRVAMLKAMEALIEADVDENVGGFPVFISSKADSYQYLSHVSLIGLAKGQIITEEWTTPKLAGAIDGGYAYSLLRPLDNNIPAIAIHIFQIRLGIFYHPLKFPDPFIVRGLMPLPFIDYIEREHGVKLGGFRVGD